MLILLLCTSLAHAADTPNPFGERRLARELAKYLGVYTPMSPDPELGSLYRFAILNENGDRPELTVDEYLDGKIYRLWNAPLAALMPYLNPESYSDKKVMFGFGAMRPKTIQIDLFSANRHIHVERFLYIPYFDPHRPSLSFHLLSYGKQGIEGPGPMHKVDIQRRDYNGILVMEEQALYASGEKTGVAPMDFISGNYSDDVVISVCESRLRRQ